MRGAFMFKWQYPGVNLLVAGHGAPDLHPKIGYSVKDFRLAGWPSKKKLDPILHTLHPEKFKEVQKFKYKKE